MIDISKLDTHQLDRFIHMQSIVDRQLQDAASVRALREYYKGEHPVFLTQRQQEYIGPLLTEAEFHFSHNLVRSVVDTLRERLKVVGFAVNGQGADDLIKEKDEANRATMAAANPDAHAAALFWSWWNSSRMDSQQIRLYRRSLRDRAAYVVVDYDNASQSPRFSVHHVDDGTVGVTYHRDPEDPNRVLFANRYFYTFDPLTPGKTGRERRTTYLEHEIRKYIRAGGSAGIGSDGWAPYTDEGDTAWPIPWRDSSGEPLGVAVIEFANPGGSEITQLIGLQNALNKTWLDLLAAADAAGFPILGVEYDSPMPMPAATQDDIDLEGADEFRISPGRALEVFGGHFNPIPAGDMSQINGVLDTIITAMAGVSRTPQYYLRPSGGSEVPSGEALKQLESGLVRRAEERQLIFGQAWADVMALAYRIEGRFGQSPPQLKQMNIDTQWADANVRNELSESSIAESHKRLGIPDEEVWQRAGYAPEQIAGFKAAARTTRAAEVAAIAEAIRIADSRQAPQITPAAGGA